MSQRFYMNTNNERFKNSKKDFSCFLIKSGPGPYPIVGLFQVTENSYGKNQERCHMQIV